MKRRSVTLLALFMAVSMTACTIEEPDKGNKTETTQNVETIETEVESKTSDETKANEESKSEGSKTDESKSDKTKVQIEDIPMPVNSPEELTVEKVMELTNVTNMLKSFGSFRFRLTETVGEEQSQASEGIYVIKDDGVFEMNMSMVDSDGSKTMYYINTDESEPYYYVSTKNGTRRLEKDEYVMTFKDVSFADVGADEYKVISTKEEDGLYVAEMECYFDGSHLETVELSFVPETGRIQTYKIDFHETDQKMDSEFAFDRSIEADLSPKEEYEASLDKKEEGSLIFDSVDINGNPVTNDIIKGSKVVLMNLWEPWCGPCVKELPELQKLYENYKDQGLLILGVYSDSEYAKETIENAGVTYPVFKVDANLYAYEQNYVPATFLFDGNGKLLQEDPIQGSKSYEGWEEIVLEYLSE